MELDEWFEEWIKVDNDSTFDEFCENKRKRGYVEAIYKSYTPPLTPIQHAVGYAIRNSTNTYDTLGSIYNRTQRQNSLNLLSTGYARRNE